MYSQRKAAGCSPQEIIILAGASAELSWAAELSRAAQQKGLVLKGA
jgi:hypothetical protein